LFHIPAPYWTAAVLHRFLAGLLWLGVLRVAYLCSINLGRLLQLPMRPLRRLLDGPLALALVIAVLGILCIFWRRVETRHWTKWWDPASRPDGPITWTHVQGLVCDDPLDHVPRLRPIYFLGRTPIYVLSLTVVTVSLWFLLCLLDRPWLPDVFNAGTGAGRVFLQLAKPNLTAYLALIAAAASIFFAYLQLRAKVRTDNRQVWIDRARSHLAAVVELASLHSEAGATAAPDLWREFASLKLELELMLNSSERDHRLLAFLIHELALLRDGSAQAIPDSENLKALIEEDSDLPFDDWLPEWNQRGQLVTYILRLSHVVLKREWERVKHTR
jgi:hypothetical protein